MPWLARNCTIKTISAAFFVAGSVKARGRLQNRNEFNVRYQAATLSPDDLLEFGWGEGPAVTTDHMRKAAELPCRGPNPNLFVISDETSISRAVGAARLRLHWTQYDNAHELQAAAARRLEREVSVNARAVIRPKM